MLSSLLVLGADPAALDGDGCTPELVAKRAGQTLCQQILQVVVAEEQKESWYFWFSFLNILIEFGLHLGKFIQNTYYTACLKFDMFHSTSNISIYV